MKKHKPTQAEITNDPSIRWTPYKKWEVVESDTYGLVRFSGYAADGSVELTTLLGMGQIAGSVQSTTIRRPTPRAQVNSDERTAVLHTAIATAKYRLSRNIPE